MDSAEISFSESASGMILCGAWYASRGLTNGSVIFSELNNGYIKVIDKENWEKWEDSDEL